MAWRTEYLRADTAARARFGDDHPYLAALLWSSPEATSVVRSRLRNYLAARRAERDRPDVVDALPYHVVLDPSTVCNLRCPLCVQATDGAGRRRTMLEVDAYRRLLVELQAHTIRLDLFNWGEPLLHPRFSEIVRMASDRSMHTRTSSNLSHDRPLDADALVTSGLRYLVASIDGATQKTYQTYRVRGRLAVALDNLRRLVDVRDRLGVDWPLLEWQFLALRHNVDEVDRARQMAVECGVDVFRVGGARAAMATKLTLPPRESYARSANLLLESAHPLSEYYEDGSKRRHEETAGCRWLWGKAALNPDGGISPCLSSWFQKDDLSSWSDGLGHAWNGEPFRQARRAARGEGAPLNDKVCDVCSRHRNFVPVPDDDREPLPGPGSVDAFFVQAAMAGVSIDSGVREVIREELGRVSPAELEAL